MAADDSAQAAALQSFRDERQPLQTVPLEKFVQRSENDLRAIILANKDKNGLAVIVGITENGPTGVSKDVEAMTTTFKNLNLAIWQVNNACSATITSVLLAIQKFRFNAFKTYKFIIFYFSGHGGSLDGRSFIKSSDESDNSMLYIKEDIVSYLWPSETPHLEPSVCRIFLFDCCLVDDEIRVMPRLYGRTHVEKPMSKEHVLKEENSKEPLSKETISKEHKSKNHISKPLPANILIAYATTINSSARADFNEGGVWTKYLSKNMVDMDLPFSAVLDLTWENTLSDLNQKFEDQIRVGDMEPQVPHYESSSGLIWLKHPEWDQNMRCSSLPTGPQLAKGGDEVDYSTTPEQQIPQEAAPSQMKTADNQTPSRGQGQRISDSDLAVLKKAYAENPKPTKEVRKKLAQQLSLPDLTVDGWFSRQRSSEKKDPHSQMIAHLFGLLQGLQSWYQLALALKLSVNHAREIKKEYNNDYEDCLSKVLEIWLKERNITQRKKTLVEALEAIREHDIAAKVHEEFHDPSK